MLPFLWATSSLKKYFAISEIHESLNFCCKIWDSVSANCVQFCLLLEKNKKILLNSAKLTLKVCESVNFSTSVFQLFSFFLSKYKVKEPHVSRHSA
jgi:hypothetical protein